MGSKQDDRKPLGSFLYDPFMGVVNTAFSPHSTQFFSFAGQIRQLKRGGWGRGVLGRGGKFFKQLALWVASSLGRYVFGSEISYNKAPPRLPGLGC